MTGWYKSVKATPGVINMFNFGMQIKFPGDTLKKVLHPYPKLSMFCAISQNDHHLLENDICIL